MIIYTIIAIHDKKLLSDISYSYLDENNKEIMKAKKTYLRKLTNKAYPTYKIGDIAFDSINMVEELKSRGVKKIRISFSIDKSINYLFIIDINVKTHLILLPSYYMSLFYEDIKCYPYATNYKKSFEDFISREDIKYAIGNVPKNDNEEINYALTNFTMENFALHSFIEILKTEHKFFEQYFISGN
jgi:hypothetical protein